jgi:hypothetical protein
MDEALKEQTRREWRELGFFYGRSDPSKEWVIVGSREGLLRFRDLLLAYVADPRNEKKSEHEHYGPYSYLEIMTWPDPGMDGHAIHGSLSDLRRLAEIIDAKVDVASSGARITIRDEYAANAEFSLVLEMREDDFDPASADAGLVS